MTASSSNITVAEIYHAALEAVLRLPPGNVHAAPTTSILLHVVAAVIGNMDEDMKEKILKTLQLSGKV